MSRILLEEPEVLFRYVLISRLHIGAASLPHFCGR